MDINKIFSGDTSGLTEEEKIQVDKFTDNLKDNLIDELVKAEIDELLCKLNRDKEEFEDTIRSILVNGSKGYNKMPLQILINIYLDKKGNEKFISLIEEIQ